MSYSAIISKDLPSIVWSLDDATITSGSSIASDGFLSGKNGTYVATCTKKSFPIINGSSQSIIITQNNPTYALSVPSLDMLSNERNYQNMTLEFWLKFIDSPSATSITEIVKKRNSQTGIYFQNSSIVAIIGDEFSKHYRVAVPVDNIYRPMNIILIQSEKSIQLIVNGISNSVEYDPACLTKAYSSSDEYFDFYYNSSIGKYAIDNISIYSRALSIIDARRHLAYGLGYEIPESYISAYAGNKYSLSMLETPITGKVERAAKFWSAPAKIDNLRIDSFGNLTSQKVSLPVLGYAKDKTSDVFSWDSTSGLIVSTGGFVEVSSASQYIKEGNGGYATVLNKQNGFKLADGDTSMLLSVSDNTSGKNNFSLKIFLKGTSAGEEIYAQLNNETPDLLKAVSGSVNGITGDFVVGYIYNISTNTIKIFYGIDGVTGTSYVEKDNSPIDGLYLFPLSNNSIVRVGSDIKTSITADDSSSKTYFGGIKRIVQLDSVDTTTPNTVFDEITQKVDRYTAIANSTEKRFTISSSGTYEFLFPIKKLAGTQSFVGTNIVEWGYNGTEVSISASGVGNSTESSWLASSETLENRKPFLGVIGVAPGVSKGAKIIVTIDSNDAFANPVKVPYFRIIGYKTELSSGVYSTAIQPKSAQPALTLKYTSATKSYIQTPAHYSTPFLFDEERGGIKVGYICTIDYNIPVISGADSTSGINTISFFVNINSSTSREILKVVSGATTYTLSYTGSALSMSGSAKVFVNGIETTTISRDVWQHVVVSFNSRLEISDTTYPVITFGDTSKTVALYVDEIVIMDNFASTDVDDLFKYITNTNIYSVSQTEDAEINIIDSEVSNSTVVIQPLGSQDDIADYVFLATTKALSGWTWSSPNLTKTFSEVSDLIIDGIQLSDGDRVLIKNQASATQNGIFVFSYNEDTDLATFTRETITANSAVYVKNGLVNKNRYFIGSSGSTWSETVIQPKVVSYSVPTAS